MAYLTVKEAAEKYGVSERTIRERLKKGEIRGKQLCKGGRWYVEKERPAPAIEEVTGREVVVTTTFEGDFTCSPI